MYDNDISDNHQKTRDKYSDIFYYFDGLLNTAISQSMHPAGIVISPIPIDKTYGVFHSDGKNICYLNMEELHDCGSLKYDILG